MTSYRTVTADGAELFYREGGDPAQGSRTTCG
jgi:hypothetical protein